MTEGSERSPSAHQPTEDPVDPAGPGRPGLVHVSELLAAHGRSAAPAGGRRRRAVEEASAEEAPVEDAVVEEPPVVAPAHGAVPGPEPEPVAAPAAVVDPEPEHEHEPAAGGLGEWAVVVGQLVGALVVGAALWFGFRYLWDHVPVLAAVLATLLTIGLVVGVRTLRRDTDLLSSALAVVAGLVVAFSPPVLALTGG